MSISISTALIVYTRPITPMEFLRSIAEKELSKKSIEERMPRPPSSPIEKIIRSLENRRGKVLSGSDIPDIMHPSNFNPHVLFELINRAALEASDKTGKLSEIRTRSESINISDMLVMKPLV